MTEAERDPTSGEVIVRSTDHGVEPAIKHGCYTPTLVNPRAAELIEAMAADVTWLSPVDRVTLVNFAHIQSRIERAEAWLLEHGDADDRGRPRPLVAVLRSWYETARRYADALGLTPQARMSLRIGDVRARALERPPANADDVAAIEGRIMARLEVQK